MFTLDRILFPVDLSEQCRRVAPFVKAMAQRFQSEVTLLHVLEVPATWYAPPETAWAVMVNIETLREFRKLQLDTFLTEGFAGLSVNRVMAEGDAATQINCFAKTNKTDLIMMPTHGYGAFRRVLLGSVTAKVLHDSACPVWTGIHTRELTAHDPARLRRILCAVDSNEKDAAVIRWVSELAESQGAQAQLVHAIPGVDTASAQADPTFAEFLFKVARERIQRMQDEAGTKFELLLHGGKPERVVRDAAFDFDADLIVIGRGADHVLGRLRSDGYSIIRDAPCPVLSV